MFTKAMITLWAVVFVLLASSGVAWGLAVVVATFCAGLPWAIVDMLDPEDA